MARLETQLDGSHAAQDAPPSPDLLAAVLDALDQRVMLLDRHGRVVVFNHACERVTGWSAREIVGRLLWEVLLEPTEANWMARVFDQLRSDAIPPQLEMRWRTRDHGVPISTWTARGLVGPDGALSHVLALGTGPAEPVAPAGSLGHRELLELLPDAVCVFRDRSTLYMNPACRRLLGVAQDGPVAGLSILDFVRPASRARVGALLSRTEQGQRDLPVMPEWLQRADGTRIFAEIWASRLDWEGGQATAVYLRDNAWRQASADGSAGSADGFALASESSTSGLWEYNDITHVLTVTPRLKQLLGYSDEEFPKDPVAFYELLHPDDEPTVMSAVQAYRLGEAPGLEVEARLRHRAGQWRWFQIRGAAARLPDGTVYRLAGSIDDIDLRKESDRRVAEADRTDTLTGLTSRAELLVRLARRLERARQPDGGRFGVLFLDVDRFQVVNDSLGHVFGDDVLIEIGRRLQRCVRMQDTVARFGGDEFTILLDELQDARDAARVADRIHAQLSGPLQTRGKDVFVTVSVGIAVDEGHYVSPSEVLRDADNAMYRAKALGRAQHVVFHRSMHLAALQAFELETDLHHALEREEFVVHYQPIVRLLDGRVVGFEALVRWQHPRRGLLGPSDFIPLAEDSGLIVPLGLWVIQRAAADLRGLLASPLAPRDLWVAVNLSARQFQQVDLVECIRDTLSEEGVSPRHLKLEVTESTLMEDPRAARAMLERLRALSIQVTIDDFGTGYSSLSHLSMFPLDGLKIDRTFVNMLNGVTGGELSLARSIIALARQVGLEAIAEGVETPAQAEALRALDCEFAQGFYFERPVPVQTAIRLLALQGP